MILFNSFSDLIETQWNVNEEYIDAKEEYMGFNRNIVECKYVTFYEFCVCCLDLIETQWNVNLIDDMLRNRKEIDLIETQWNVNENENVKSDMDSWI